MFNTGLATVVNTIVDDILRQSLIAGKEKKVMFVDLRLHVALDHETPVKERYVHLMYHVSSSYVLVGSQLSDNSLFEHRDWKFESHHDSTWRQVAQRLSAEQYYLMCREVNPEVPPASLFTTGDIYSIQFREIAEAPCQDGKRIKLSFPAPV